VSDKLKIEHKPLIDVAITCFNSSKYIEACLHSILMQTYKNWKLIIVDDGSTDNTINIIRQFIKANKISKKCKLFAINKNCGYGMSLKTAIEKGTGDFIAIVDSDDALATKEALEIMVTEQQRLPHVALIYSNYYECDIGLKSQTLIRCRNPRPGETYLEGNVKTALKISHLKTFKRSFYNLTEGLNGNLLKAVDKDLILKLEEVGEIRHIPYDLYLHRKTGTSISSNFKNLAPETKLRVLEMKAEMYDSARRRRANK
jgi:glycosyltransferase involved in cell wall biosynthesis